VFVAEDAGTIVGTYYLRANNRGGGAHVANCGYVVAPDAFGRGVARAMCTHSLDQARTRKFTAMQFNFVIASNERAVRLWESLGFAIHPPPACQDISNLNQMREFSAAASARSHRLHDAFGHFLRVAEQHHCVVAIE
jgi:GNAT superfamily N-acetyltransferase